MKAGADRQASRADANQVREAAVGRWPGILSRLGVGHEFLTSRHGPCPACGGKDRFRYDDQGGRGTWICSQGGGEPAAGDGFALLEHVHGWGFRDALAAVADALGMGDGNAPSAAAPRRAPPPAEPPPKLRTLHPDWQRRWHKARVITPADPAGRYLSGRGCILPPEGSDIGWHPRVGHWQSGHVGPALVALISDARSARPVTLHFTWIAEDGAAKADLGDYPNRLTLPGHSNVGVIRLWPDEEVTTGLALAEGIETALTAARVFTPIWSTATANNLARMPRLPGIEALTIFVDDDPAGRKAAAACAAHWRETHAEVRLIDGPEVADGR